MAFTRKPNCDGWLPMVTHYYSRRAMAADGDALLPVGGHAPLEECSGLPLTESLDDGSRLAMV